MGIIRILGLDYGSKTIGVAVSDPFGWTAQGLEIIRRSDEEAINKSIIRLVEIVEQYQVSEIVLGYPKNMNNTEGARCEKTLLFKEKLQSKLDCVKITLVDERLSTQGSERSLLEGNVTRKKRSAVIDKMAAVFILQGYLDMRRKEV